MRYIDKEKKSLRTHRKRKECVKLYDVTCEMGWGLRDLRFDVANQKTVEYY